MGLLIGLMFYLLIQSGDDGSGEQTLLDKFKGSDAYYALLYGTMASALLSLIYYHLLFKENGKLLFPTPSVLTEYVQGMLFGAPTDVRPLMTIKESINAFVYGMSHVFPAVAILTLAWASGNIVNAIGTDRLFAAWVTGGLAVDSLPTILFVVSLLMALATGTSWGTMAIMFPLIVVPTYDASGGDEAIVYATIAGILSGAVAGDHVSPISDTTVLSSLADWMRFGQPRFDSRYVVDYSPCVFWVCLISILVETLPVGYGGYPNFIAFALGYGLILAMVLLLCKPVISKTGDFDIFTELYLSLKPDSDLSQLKIDTANKFAGNDEEPLKAAPVHMASVQEAEDYSLGQELNEDSDDEEEIIM